MESPLINRKVTLREGTHKFSEGAYLDIVAISGRYVTLRMNCQAFSRKELEEMSELLLEISKIWSTEHELPTNL